jgi:hypothetical protein
MPSMARTGTLLSLATMAKGALVSFNPKRTKGDRVLKTKVLLGWLVVLVGSSWLCEEAQAIPPFARKYGTSCQTCHVIIPKLNAFGEAFRLNGYKIADADAALVKEEPAALGAPAYKEMFPNSMWPSSIPGLPPIGVRVTSSIMGTRDQTSTRRSDLVFPEEVAILAGGRFDEHLGVLTEITLDKDGKAGIDQANLFVNNIMSWAGVPEHALSARIGKMDTQLLLSYNEPTKVGHSAPLWGDFSIGNWKLLDSTGTPVSPVNSFSLSESKAAVELNGILARRFYWGAALTTGVGADINHMDGYYKLKYKPFGRDFLGKFAADEEVSTASKPGGGWVDNGLLLEHFGYFGRMPTNPTLAGDAVDDRFRYLGGAVRWTPGDLDLAVGYIRGRHDRPFGASTTQATDVRTSFVKAEYMLFPWLMARAVYETLKVDQPDPTLLPVGPADFGTPGTPGVGYNGSPNVHKLLVGPIFSPRANLTVALEAEIFLKHEGADLVGKNKPSNLWLRVDFAY